MSGTPTSAIQHIHPSRRESMGISNFSGNGTPRTMAIPMDLDQPQPAMFSYDDAPADYPALTYPKANNAVAASNWKMVAKHLDSFARAVDEYYKFSSARATAQAKIEKLESENRRWADQRGDFQSLAEEQAKDLKKLKDSAARLDEKLEALRIDRDEKNKTLSMNIAGLVNPESAAIMKKVETKVQTLEDEIKQLKLSHEKDLNDMKASIAAITSPAVSRDADIKELKASLAAAASRDAEIKALKASVAAASSRDADIKELKASVAAAASRDAQIKELKASVAAVASSAAVSKSDRRAYGSDDFKIEKLTADVTENQRSLQKLQLEVKGPGGAIPKLEARVSAIEKTGLAKNSDPRKHEEPQKKPVQMSDIEDLQKQLKSSLSFRTELDDVLKKVGSMSERLESATANRTEMDTVLQKANIELGSVRERVDSLYTSMQVVKDEVTKIRPTSIPEDLEQRLKNLLDRISDIKDDQDSLSDKLTLHSSRLSSLVQAQTSNVTRFELETSVERAVQESPGVAAGLAQLRSEQEDKDDLVSQEVERLDRGLSAAQTSTEQLVLAVKDLSQGLLAAKRAEADKSGKSTTVAVADSTKLTEDAKVAEFNTRITVCESAFKSLQHRFDNLSTAELAKNMVHQMASMYSYPANVSAQLEKLERNYSAIVQSVTTNKNRMEVEFAKHAHLLKTPVDVANQRAMLSDHAAKINSLEYRQLATISEQADKINSLEDQLLGFSTQFSQLSNHPQMIKALEDKTVALSKDMEGLAQSPKDISLKVEHATHQFATTINSVKKDMKAISDTLATKVAHADYKKSKSSTEKKIAEMEGRIDDMETTVLQEISSLHARVDINERRVSQLMGHFGISEDGTSNGIADDPSENGPTLGSTPNLTLALDDDEEEGDDDDDEDDGNGTGERGNNGASDSETESVIKGRSASLKRKRAGKGQSSTKSDGSDSDVNPRRKARATD
jgi:chromosome segregation ATPase